MNTFVNGLVAAAMLAGSVAAWAADTAPVGGAIENELYCVRVDAGAGEFSATRKSSGRVFLADGKLSGTRGTARVADVSDKTFGQGKCIEIAYPDGNRDTIALYQGRPFIHFGGSRHNGGTEPVVLNHVQTISAAVELGQPQAALRTLGTGGLLSPQKNPGSYAFLAVADPKSRTGVVGGWISHDRGCGVVFSPVDDKAVRLQAQIDYGCLRIKPGQDAAMETFAVGYFDDARLGLEAYADAVAKFYSIKLPPHHPGFCTWYTEKKGGYLDKVGGAGACNEKDIVELAEYAAKNLKPFGFGFIQIDDGWQEGLRITGPRKNFTTHTPKGPYPSGMKATADNIKNLGLTPGIWFMPFAGTSTDPYFKDHQDWFAKRVTGVPYETAWGGTCLDTSSPGAQEHIRSVSARIARDWGCRLFKLDGFWTGSSTKQIYVNDGYKEDGMGDAVFSNPDKTNIEALRDGAKLVRAAAGPDVFLLGCCVSQNMRSFGGAFGLVDAMRVGPDTGAGYIGAPHASRLWFLNGRVWWNDPDCVSVRASTTLERARLNASFTAVADNLFYNSDWMPDFPPERLDILRRCMPAHNGSARPVDVFESQPARIWHVTDTRNAVRRDVVAFYNWYKSPLTIECAADRIGLPPAPEYVAFDFWANQLVPPFKDVVRAELPGGDGSCRILAIKPVSEHPQLLSTSRHITQGIVDVVDEKWDDETRTLSGTSQVVGSDPYELRIVLPGNGHAWRVQNAGVSKKDLADGATVEHKQTGPLLRVTIHSPTSQNVRWLVRFEK